MREEAGKMSDSIHRSIIAPPMHVLYYNLFRKGRGKGKGQGHTAILYIKLHIAMASALHQHTNPLVSMED